MRLGIQNAGPSFSSVSRRTPPRQRGSGPGRVPAPRCSGTTSGQTAVRQSACSPTPTSSSPGVRETFELDRRLALAAGLPELVDVLASYDFAILGGSDGADLATTLDAARTDFAAINDWLPAFLVGRDTTAPDEAQLSQTLAFAARVGWADLGATSTPPSCFAAAIAYLRANRLLQSALLPIGFDGDREPLAFLNAPRAILTLGRNTGVLDDAVVGGLAALLDQALGPVGVDAAAAPPPELTQALQQQLFALVASQIPRPLAASPAIQAQFVASLGYLRQATTGADLRQRIVTVLAAFRTLAVTGAPALTERQIVDALGPDALGVLGVDGWLRARRRRRRTRSSSSWPAVGRARRPQAGYRQIQRVHLSFNDLGELSGIVARRRAPCRESWTPSSRWARRSSSRGRTIRSRPSSRSARSPSAPPRSWSRPTGTRCRVAGAQRRRGRGLRAAGRLALGDGSRPVRVHRRRDRIFGAGAQTIVTAAQNTIATDVLGPNVLSLTKDAKRAFDIGTSIYNATEAKALIGAVANGSVRGHDHRRWRADCRAASA